MDPRIATWQQAGLYDPAAPEADDRLALLRFLDEQGCELDEMVEAHANGRLFALSGDRIIWPSRGRKKAAEVAAELGIDEDVIWRAWRALGLPTPEGPVLNDADVEALRTWLLVRDLLGEEAALGLNRVLGASIARFAEAESSAIRVGLDSVDLGRNPSEVAVAQSFLGVAELVPRIGQVLDAVHRHHLDAARRHFEQVQPTADDSVRCGVGFADLSGFTHMSQAMPMSSLSYLLTAFEESASDAVQQHGGRVVKFLGDAVMFVSPGPFGLADVACSLVEHPRAREAGLAVRAGIAYGDMLAQDGDYFGPPVNLAARLVTVAGPGEVLAGPTMAGLLGSEFEATPGEAHVLAGIDEPVTPYRVVRTAGCGPLTATAPRPLDGPIQKNALVPYYVQLSVILKARILAVEWGPDELLPSESELCAAFGLSRTAVRQALGVLALDGLVYRVKGRGTFVSPPRAVRLGVQDVRGLQDVLTSGPSGRVLSVVAEQLEQTSVVRVDHLALLDGEPAGLVRSLLPRARFGALLEADLTQRDLYDLLRSEFGVRPGGGDRQVTAATADAAVAAALDVQPGAPLLRVDWVDVDQDGVAFLAATGWYRADRAALTVRVAEG